MNESVTGMDLNNSLREKVVCLWIPDVITNLVNLILNLGLSLHERLFLTLHASFHGREIKQQINEKAK